MTKASVVTKKEQLKVVLRNKLRKVYRFLVKPYRYLIQKKYHVSSFKQWCLSNNKAFTVIPSDKTVSITHPQIHTDGSYQYPFQSLQSNLPEVYLARLERVTLIEGSDIVLTKDKTALYDEMAYDEEGKYGIRINKSKLIVSRNIHPTRIGLKFKLSNRQLPKTAIHFCKDYSFNYFHWLLEALPRLWIIDQFKEFDQLPLIVDDLLPQQIEALKLYNSKPRELIHLHRGEACTIENLIYPSGLSHAHDNYTHPIEYDKEFVISPHAINFLRKALPALAPGVTADKKIYLSRKRLGVNKRLLNDEEIADFLSQHGFEVVYPETLSFIEQIHLFARAKLIVGASGAGLANLVYAPSGCDVYVLSANNERVNTALFAGIADTVKLNLHYIFGRDQVNDPYSKGHNSYHIDMRLINDAITFQ